MHQFNDSKGRTWTIRLTIGHISPIEQETGVDLFKIDKPYANDSTDYVDAAGKPLPLIVRLGLDLELLFSVIYAACMLEAGDDGAVEPFDFGSAMEDNASVDAQDAFFKELIHFFQTARRPELQAMVEKVRATLQAAMSKATEMASERIDPNEIVNRVFESGFGEPAA